jgi:hypothetical protein
MDQNVVIKVVIVFFLIVSATTALLLIRRQRATQKKAFSRWPGELSSLESGKTIAGEHDGTAYEVYYFAGGKNAPPLLTLSVPCPSEGRFKITKESGFDRFFKRHGITNEVQTFDKSFDDDYFIQSDTLDFVRQFFQPPEKRQAVRAVFELGYTLVEHDGKVMKITFSPFRPKDDLPPEFVTGAVAQLRELATNIPVVPPTPAPDMGAWKTKRVVAFAVPIFGDLIGLPLIILGFVLYPPLDGFSIFLDSLKYSLPLLLIFLWLAVKLIRGRSTSHHELIAVGVLALIGFPLAGMGLETFLNGRLDSSQPSSHTVVVIDKYISRSNKSKDYNLVLESWRTGRQSETLEVSSRDYERVVLTQTEVQIETKPGRFGFEWRVSYEIL